MLSTDILPLTTSLTSTQVYSIKKMEEKVKTKKNLNAITNEMKEICTKLFHLSNDIPAETISIISSKLNSRIFKDLVKESSLKIALKKTDSNAPDKPKSAYLLFSNVKSTELRQSGDKFTIPEITRIVADEWKKLSADDHLMYANLAATQREQYNKKLNEYNAQMKRDDPNFVIKKPTSKSAFSYFIEDEKIKQVTNDEFVNADKKTQNSMLREIWKRMNNGTVEERKQIINYKKRATLDMDETLKVEEEIEKNYKRKLEESATTETGTKKQKIDVDEKKEKKLKKKEVEVEEEVKKKEVKKKEIKKVVKKPVVIAHIDEESEESGEESGDENDKKMRNEFDLKIKPKSSM